jgi:nucleoside-diphosphate-sugar epimerase
VKLQVAGYQVSSSPRFRLKMRVLAIGATGFIGPHVVRRLLRRGHDVAVLHRGRTSAGLPDGVQHVRGDRSALGDVAGWNGEVVTMPDGQLPEHLNTPSSDWAYDLATDTSRFREELAYTEPVSENTALERTVAWQQANPPEEIDEQQFNYAAEDAAAKRA